MRVPKRSTPETYPYGNFPPGRLASVVKSSRKQQRYNAFLNKHSLGWATTLRLRDCACSPHGEDGAGSVGRYLVRRRCCEMRRRKQVGGATDVQDDKIRSFVF